MKILSLAHRAESRYINDMGSAVQPGKQERKMPWIKVINVQLKQDVINPRYNSMTRSRYLLAEKGEKMMFSYDPKDVSADTLRVIEKIKAGESFPVGYGTRHQAWAKKFEYLGEVDYFDDPGAKCYD